ncbi:MAG: hypothetical protein PF961_23705 [Planctomycetota bacterium]|jgi:hypothetical protein|nr:hypothetical protein [Planctomycetota bacterium]
MPTERISDLAAVPVINGLFDRCSQYGIRSVYLANQVMEPGPTYIRDLIIELSKPPAMNDVAVKLFCLDASHASLDEQTMIDRCQCKVVDVAGQAVFHLLSGGQNDFHVTCRSIGIEVF